MLHYKDANFPVLSPFTQLSAARVQKKTFKYVFNGVGHIVCLTYCSDCKGMLVGKVHKMIFLSPVNKKEFDVTWVSSSYIVLVTRIEEKKTGFIFYVVLVNLFNFNAEVLGSHLASSVSQGMGSTT